MKKEIGQVISALQTTDPRVISRALQFHGLYRYYTRDFEIWERRAKHGELQIVYEGKSYQLEEFRAQVFPGLIRECEEAHKQLARVFAGLPVISCTPGNYLELLLELKKCLSEIPFESIVYHEESRKCIFLFQQPDKSAKGGEYHSALHSLCQVFFRFVLERSILQSLDREKREKIMCFNKLGESPAHMHEILLAIKDDDQSPIKLDDKEKKDIIDALLETKKSICNLGAGMDVWSEEFKLMVTGKIPAENDEQKFLQLLGADVEDYFDYAENMKPVFFHPLNNLLRPLSEDYLYREELKKMGYNLDEFKEPFSFKKEAEIPERRDIR